jgi:HNH endonuclease
MPAELKRQVLMEAGHRCAIPTCRSIPVVIAHIVPWATVQEHKFANLIALCPTCHARFDGGDIDRLSMRGYKANLSVVSSRYGETERRVLDWFSQNAGVTGLRMTGGQDIHLMYLINDGLLAKAPLDPVVFIDGLPAHEDYLLTDAGREFVAHWVRAEPVSLEAEEQDDQDEQAAPEH